MCPVACQRGYPEEVPKDRCDAPVQRKSEALGTRGELSCLSMAQDATKLGSAGQRILAIEAACWGGGVKF